MVRGGGYRGGGIGRGGGLQVGAGSIQVVEVYR